MVAKASNIIGIFNCRKSDSGGFDLGIGCGVARIIPVQLFYLPIVTENIT